MMNRQGNTYTIIYSALLVLAVGIVLSLVYQALRPTQLENMANDKKKQILSAIRISPQKGENVGELYNKYIKQSYLVSFRGDKITSDISPFDVDVANEVKRPDNERLLPVFEASTPEGIKYIIPCYGAGLWGPIWGYVAFDANGDTIYGAYFSHQGETPGLGAEIEKLAFQNQFQGKNIFSNGAFTSIAVMKAGQYPAQGDYVQAISGGTITSQGVQRMLAASLRPYEAFFVKLQESSAKSEI